MIVVGGIVWLMYAGHTRLKSSQTTQMFGKTTTCDDSLIVQYIIQTRLTFDPLLGFIERFLAGDVIDYHSSVSPPIVHGSLDSTDRVV